MKRNLLLLIVLCCTMTMMAQNGNISYQAVVRDSENKLVHDTELQVTVSLANSATGAAVYSELHNVTSNANGLISLLIGDSDEMLPGSDWNAVQWNTAWVTATIRKASDQTFLAEHHLPLSAVPYALYADEVDTIFLQNYLTTHDYGNDDYVTHEQLNDTLAAYYDTTRTKSVISDTATALRNMMGDAAYDGQLTIIAAGDTTRFTANQATNDTVRLNKFATKDTLSKYTTSDQIDTLLKNYVKGNDLCDSIEKNCTNVALKNKDNLFTLRNQFDSTVFFKDATYFDSTAYFNERAYFDEDVNVKGDVIFKGYNYYFSVNNFYEHDAIVLIDEAVNKNTLGPVQSTPDDNLNRKLSVNYNDLMVVYDTLKKQMQNGNAGLESRIVSDSNRLVEFKGKVHNDSLVLAEKIRTDSITVMDTLHSYYATKDTLKNFLTTSGLCDSVVKCGVIKDMRDSIRNNATAIQTNATNIGRNEQAIIDSSANIRKEIKYGQITIALNLGTETGVTNPTFGVNQTDTQTVTINIPEATTVNNGQLTIVAAGDTTRFTANQATNDTVRLDKFATKDTLSKYTTTDNIDTIVNKHHFLTSDSALIVRMRDSIQKVNAHVSADSLVLATKIHDDSLTLATKLHADSVDLAKHISDSTRMVFDTLHNYYATKDTLKNFVNKLAIRDSVNKIVKDSLRIGTSAINIAIDTIARHNIHDTAVAIRNSIGNGTLTIQKNGTTVGTFTANQSTDQPVNVNITVPTAVTDLSDAADYAKINGNTFTGTHDFTGATITVPSNETTIKRPIPTTTPAPECSMNAVNVCDLLAVFDSLTKRISDLEDELRALKGATPPTVSVSLSEVHSNSIKATATANGNGATVTSYEFCISENGDMSNPICHTTTTTHNTYTFTGLTGNKTYYVTAKATNLVGSTTSSVASERTPAHAPTASFALDPVSPSGFQVVVSGMNFKENGSGTVQICYKKKDGTCPVDISDYSTCDATLDIAANVTDTTRKFFYVDEAGVDYCVIVKIDNGDSITVLDPLTVATGPAISLDITHTPTLLNLCGGSLDVTFTASPNPTSVDLNDYENFTWTESNSTSNVATITYNTGGSKTVTCTATHKTEGYTITGSTNIEVNSGSAPSFTYCEDNSVVTLKSLSDVSSIAWGDGQTKSSGVQVGDTHPYGSSGTYTITATAANGCIATRTFATSGSTLFPCKVSTPHTAFTGGGFNGAHDGRETVNDTFAVTSVKDYDGNDYPVVQIGSQCWLAENMRCVHSPSTGTYIVNPEHKEGNTVSWNSASKFAQWLMNDSATYAPKHFGLLYNWAAAVDTYNVLAGRPELSQGNYETAFTPNLTSNRRGICPLGWHVPTDTEWSIMEQHVLGEDVSSEINYRGTHAAKLSKGCDWVGDSPNNGKPHDYSYSERNSSGFAGVPAGRTGSNCPSPCSYYFYHADFKYAYFWTASLSGNNAFTRDWGHEKTGVRRYPNSVCLAMSVRCVRDAESSSSSVLPHVVTSSVTDITINSATLHGSYSPNGNTINAQGFEWRKTEGGSYMVVSASGETMTYELSNLEDNTNYTYRAYVTTENNGTVYGEERTFTTEIVPPSTLMSITPNPSSGVVVCSGGSNVVKYTASVEDNGSDVSDQYKYSWSIPSGLKYYSNGNTCTVIYTSANTYTVSCTATSLNSGDPIEGVADVMVGSASGNPVPILRTAEDDGTLSVKVMPSTTDAISFNWGDNDSTYTSWTEPYQYASDGVYIIKAINGNCAATKMIAVGLATIRPCTVTSAHTESTYNPISGGGEGGLETVNGEGKVVKVLDQDGNPYAVVQIGNQCWMRSNLRTTHFSDGVTIPNGTQLNGTNHTLSYTAAYYYKPVPGAKAYADFSVSLYDEITDGLYYNWTAAMNSTTSSNDNPSNVQGVCPKGWHLPSDAEWSQMKNTVVEIAGNELEQDIGDDYLLYVNADDCAVLFCGSYEWGTNTTTTKFPGSYHNPVRNYFGFSVYPTGRARQSFENHSDTYQYSYFWSSTQSSANNSYYRSFDKGSDAFTRSNDEKRRGLSVRCVRNAE